MAQNLLTNGGFENHTVCPNFGGQINYATGWNNVNLIYGNFSVGTPDYFHTCGSGTVVPPNTFAGQCNPHTGNAMSALVLYNSPYPGYREYMSTPLSCPMVPGNTYTVSFWVTSGLNPISRYTIKNIGIHFSAAPLTQAGYALINVVPQVEVTTMIGSTAWVNYTFTVIPTATWNHLTIGAFRPDAQNTPTSTYSITTGPPSVYANYFFDDIEVLAPAIPAVGFGSLGTQSICLGQSAVITPTASGNYSITPGNITGQSFTVSPSASTTYTITNGITGCSSSSATISVVVNPVPAVSVTSMTICQGQAATLTASGAGSYTWQPSGLNGAVFTAQPSVSTTYTVTGANGACTSSVIASVSVTPLPALSALSATICAGETATLTASSTVGYTWSPSGITTSTIQVQPSATSVYTVLSSDGNCVSSATATVSVVPLPLISVTGQTICSGQTATLAASGAGSYTWQPSGAVTPTITLQPTANGVYSVSGSNGACASTTSGTITVVAVPVLVTADTSVCAGNAATLHATGASGYTWSPVNLQGAAVSVQPLINTSYTVTGSNGVCTSSAVATVTVMPAPTLSVTSATICAGQSATLTAGSASGYTWSPSGANTSTLVVQPSGSVVYTVSGSNNNTCLSVVQASVTVVAYPALSIGNPTVCSGRVATLNASGAASYTWMPQNISASSVTVQLVSNTVYTITGSNGSCLSSTVIPVTVHNQPMLSVNSGTVCFGQSQLLSSSGAVSYTWQPATGLNATGSSTVSANPLSSTTYTVLGSNAFGCVGSAVATVSVIPSPSLAIVASSSVICSGASASLSVTGAAGSYTWTSSPSGTSGSAMPFVVTPSVTTVYSVTANNGIMPNVCSSTQSITIQVLQQVTAVTGYADPVCLGSSTILSATGGNVYSWQPTAGLNHPNDSVTKAGPLVTTIYTVTVSKQGKCTGTSTVQVSVNPLPGVYAGRDTTINTGEFTLLSGSGNVEVGFVPFNGQWLGCNFCSELTVYPDKNTCYILEGTNRYGCTDRDTVCVVVTKEWEVYIPNAFTPNGDNDNEVFIPIGYGIAEIRLSIFDRWGSLIFRSHDEIIGWDGTYKGKLCQQDVYIYQAEITTIAGYTVKRTGHVTLLPKKL